MKRKGIDFDSGTRRPVSGTDVSPHFHKTAMMKYLESKYHITIEYVLHLGTIDEVAAFLGNEVDRSTISKWRNKLDLYMEARNATR